MLKFLGIVVAVLVAVHPGTAVAQEQPTEFQVKAAFLFNFVKFVEWPADTFHEGDGHIRLCVLGDERLARELGRLVTGKVVDGHALEAIRITASEHGRGCQVVFVASSQAGGRDAVAQLRGASVLTVGDSADFIRQGGMIRFFLLDNRVRFEINRAAADHCRLKISSKLLALAQSAGRAGGG